jgi:import inner membrane translocase subunit TIM17
MREDTNREPCPWRIVDDAGGAFVFGVAGGTVWHAVGGARNAAKGHMMAQALSRVKTRVPILGGSFAVWGTLFSCFDCSFTYLRKKEDPWNAIISGAATGGLLAARAGPKVAAKNAAFGGIILAAIEGLNVMISRVVVPYFERKSNESSGIMSAVDRLEPPVDPLRRRSGRVAHVPIDFAPSQADTSGFGSMGGDAVPDFAVESWSSSADKKPAESSKSKGWW